MWSKDLIGKITHEEVFHRLGSGQRVIFLDAREPAEYSEEHLPGAINLPLRHASDEILKWMVGGETVIAYCIKDFRGYEVARALRRAGFANVRVLDDPGLKGWKKARLPTAGAVPGKSDEQALAALRELAVR